MNYAYLDHLISHAPIDEKTHAMCEEQDIGEMTKPNMVFDTRL